MESISFSELLEAAVGTGVGDTVLADFKIQEASGSGVELFLGNMALAARIYIYCDFCFKNIK